MSGVSSSCRRACLFALGVLVAGGCSPGNPRDADGASVLRHQVESQGRGLIRLVGFRKTSGRRSALLGVTMYTMDFSAEIEFLKDACYGGGLSAHAYLPPRYDRSGLPVSEDSAGSCFRVHVSKGEHREVTGSLPFEGIKNGGWRGPDGRLY